MGTKRSRENADYCVDRSKTSKKSKDDRIHKSEVDNPTLDFRPKRDDDPLLQQLKKDVGELVKYAKLLQDCPERSKILTIASGLQTALTGSLNTGSPSAPIRPLTTTVSFPELPRISDSSLETAVFTHPGVIINSNVENQVETSYDRLEVLGDAYLEVIATRLIWQRFPGASAGRMCHIREELVKNETLAEYATKYGLDKRVSVPPEHKSQPKRWLKTKADVFEAYIAAIIMSNPNDGYETVERWLLQLWEPKLAGVEHIEPVLKSKEILAKKIMGKGIKLKYVDERPPDQKIGGRQTFYIGAYLTGWGWENQHLGSGCGLSKAIAGDNAAKQALVNVPLIDEIAKAKRVHENSNIHNSEN